MNASIREMTIDDYDEVYALWVKSEEINLSSVDSQQRIKRFLERNQGLSSVAVDNGKIVGGALCGHDGRCGYIHHLIVAKSHRLQGIGRSLVGRCMYYLASSGISKCNLFILSQNQGGLDFWKKLGYSQVELVMMSQQVTGK